MFSNFIRRLVGLRRPAAVPISLLLVLPLVLSLTRASGHVTVRSKAVIAAIKRGAESLLAWQNPKTMWEHFPRADDHGGETALVTEALLDVGQSLHLPELNIYSPQYLFTKDAGCA